MKKLFTIILIGFSTMAYGQNLSMIEKDLLKPLKKIHYWSGMGYQDKLSVADSLTKENSLLKKKLLKYTKNRPSTLGYDFKALQKEGMTIATSADKKFRIYSWDTYTGGTMHFFENVYQYQSGKVTLSESIGSSEDAKGFFSEIFTLQTDSGPIYLGYLHSILSTKLAYQNICLFKIENAQLKDAKLIKTKNGLNNSLGFEFDFFSVVNRKERPVKLIYFDEAKKEIKIPLVKANGEVTPKFITYRYTGKYFERDKK
ncbi:hypothetical protein VRU48_18530 [Pedobacter sp. KR3-3]|uniref:DUF3108 domain-containing protein n=1 Tax=Pedobacter albus TaxID=3113905 RepID=A0ABU7ICE6_9SPHI|nr:hypothetical protein [Pedobacter sp. KR3-3]MEE1947129.1 hypothetical protein [Pedobacter sp. KR3-3]